MKMNKKFSILLIIFLVWGSREYVSAQDMLPMQPHSDDLIEVSGPMHDLTMIADSIFNYINLPGAFTDIAENDILDEEGILQPFLEQLRLIRLGLAEDTLRILHIGDSHVRGHIFPQTAGMKLAQEFGLVTYNDMGVNGATCLTFTHPERIEAIAEAKPHLLILSFGTNESHNKRYNSTMHYYQMDELVKMLRRYLPDTPMLMTTPPGSYESFRQRRRQRTYSVNPRTATAVETIKRYAKEHQIAVWDMYNVVGGKQRACKNWQEAGLMRPDHVHYAAEGYTLQGELLYDALIKAYNTYVTN